MALRVALVAFACQSAHASCSSVSLTGYHGMQYTTGLKVGTPFQYQECLPDTGSFVLVTLGGQLHGHNTFN